MGKSYKQQDREARQKREEYERFRAEVKRRAYLEAKRCGQCGQYLPWVGYRHMCSIHYAGHYNGPANENAVMEQYVSQQMAQLAMQLQ